MEIGKKIIKAMLCILLLEGILLPFAFVMETKKGTACPDELQQRIGDMHVRHTAHLQREEGTAVESLMAIEDAWAIEDTRSEAAHPLVVQMHNGDEELGFDLESRTFYCTIGSEAEAWPDMQLTLHAEEGVRAAWIDDYTYDFCADAVREGYRYELLAYTDTEYAYFGVVFTGLPIVTLHVDDIREMGEEYIPARASVSGGEEFIDSAALVHLRGGGFDKGIDKPSYRIEFHRLSDKGKDKKNDLSVLGLPPDSDWLLVGNAGDATCMRNLLGFDMWNKWNEGKDAFAKLDSRMVEVFVQDEYMGLYQLMPRIREEDELLTMGGDLNTDLTARLIGMRFETGRPVSTISLPIGGCLEMRQAPEWMQMETAFKKLENYVTLNLPEDHEGYLDDEDFAQLALNSVDVYDLMSYYLFTNVCSLPYDNVKNNVYIWVQKGENGYTYTLSPWDMDSGFSPLFKDGSDSMNMWMTLPVRMLDLDVGGCRSVLWQIWQEKCAFMLTEDWIYQWIQEAEDEINVSGAYLRETERWRDGAQTLSLAEITAHTVSQISTITRHMQEVWPEDAGLSGVQQKRIP